MENQVRGIIRPYYQRLKNSTYYQKFMTWAFVTKPGSDPLVRSYLFMRRGVGLIGVLLPVVLIIGTIALNRSLEVSDSMSSYYYSVTGNIFVGSLWAIGIFLIGYQYDHLDNIVSTIAGVCAIGVSLFPTPPDTSATDLQETIGKLHGTFATGFLLALAIMAFLFTRGNPETDRERRNNKVYRSCGFAMLFFIVLAALILLVPYLSDNRWHHQIHPILWIEMASTLTFGIAWFVKGETYSMLKAAVQRLPFMKPTKTILPGASAPPTGEVL